MTRTSRILSVQLPVVSLVLLVVIPHAALGAQNSPAVISVRVSGQSGSPLAGARVHVAPAQRVLFTDADGRLVIGDLSPGIYSIEASHIGYVTQMHTVQIAADATIALQIELTVTSKRSDFVTVLGRAMHDDPRLLHQGRDSPIRVEILSADTIRSLPNANVADALGRLSGVSLERDKAEGRYLQVRGLESRFTTVLVDGVRIPPSEAGVRQINLEAFSSDGVQKIEVAKTASADREGDVIGGSVNLVTPTAGEAPLLSISSVGGYNLLQGGRPSTRVSITASSRFGNNQAWGVSLSGNYDYNGLAINNIEPEPAVVEMKEGGTTAAFTAIDLRDYRLDRKRFGFSGSVEYRPHEGSLIYANGIFAELRDHGTRWITTLEGGEFVTSSETDDTGSYSASVQHRSPKQQTYSVSGGGRHDLGAIRLDYILSYSRSGEDQLQRQASFDGPGTAFRVSPGDGRSPQFTPIPAVDQRDASQYSLKEFRIVEERTSTRSTAFGPNLSFHLGGTELKIGAKYRDENKISDANDRFYDVTGTPVFLPSQHLDSFTDPDYYFGRYLQGPNFNLQAVNGFFRSNPTAFSENSSKGHLTSDPNTWTSRETVSAIYAKARKEFHRIEVEAGLRAEHTATEFVGNALDLDEHGDWLMTRRLVGSNTYANLLPSVSLRWHAGSSSDVRLAYSLAVARPPYGQLVPSQVVSSSGKEVFAGNPTLRPTRGVNYDLLLEHRFAPAGQLEIGIFHKCLQDPVYDGSRSRIEGGPYDGYEIIQPINGPNATLSGVEIGFLGNLLFLPGSLRNLRVTLNYAHTWSEARFDVATGRSGTAALQRTAPHVLNASLAFEKGPVAVSVGTSHTSATLFTYAFLDNAPGGATGPHGDTYTYPYIQVDAQARYILGKGGVQVIVVGKNLNNHVFGFYRGSPRWSTRREYYDRSFMLGLRYLR